MSNTVRSRIWTGNPGGTGGGDGGGSDAFNGQRAITRQTPGIVGFDPESTTVIAFLENVFYPALPPVALLSVNNPQREVGSTTAYTLNWTATPQTNPITGITVNGVVETPTGAAQSGTQNNNVSSPTGTYTFSMTDTDGTLTGSSNCTLSYLYRMFWGSIAKDGLSDAPITDADILALANSALATSRNLTLSNFGGGGSHLIFAFPSIFGTPQFIINGLTNTAFTLVRDSSPFVNSQGATVLMDVWVSNNVYNSPLGSVILQ